MNKRGYTGNNELPQMTRSEYIKEYTKITEYYEKLRKEDKKCYPISIIMAIVNVALLIYFICVKNVVGVIVVGALNGSLRYRRIIRRMMYGDNLKTTVMSMLVLMFPLSSLLSRKEIIDKKEQEMLQRLEDKKQFCIEIGTYNVDE